MATKKKGRAAMKPGESVVAWVMVTVTMPDPPRFLKSQMGPTEALEAILKSTVMRMSDGSKYDYKFELVMETPRV